MDIKDVVKEKYSQIATQSVSENKRSCCGATGCSNEVYTVFSEDYAELQGYLPDADLGLGCGIPTQFANIKNGDVVLDLGSGAGNDAFVARQLVGENGRVIGIDMTESMVEKARLNAQKLNYYNVEFRLGDIETMPITANMVDVIISNCVLNLVPNKALAFQEMFRVLKPGGHFCISDVVLNGNLPVALQKSAEMYAGCVAGAIQKDEYIQLLKQVGFENVDIVKERAIEIPQDILLEYLSPEEILKLHDNGGTILSITVVGTKNSCCGSGCCA